MLKVFDYGVYGDAYVGTDIWVFVLCPTGKDDEYLCCTDKGHPMTLGEKDVLVRGNLKGSLDTPMSVMIDKLNEKKKSDTARKFEQALYFPGGELMNDTYARLVWQSKDASIEDGNFIVGVAYPIFYGCLLDEDDACIFDAIHSIDELNTWDEGIRKWELWNKSTPTEVAKKL